MLWAIGLIGGVLMLWLWRRARRSNSPLLLAMGIATIPKWSESIVEIRNLFDCLPSETVPTATEKMREFEKMAKKGPYTDEKRKDVLYQQWVILLRNFHSVGKMFGAKSCMPEPGRFDDFLKADEASSSDESAARRIITTYREFGRTCNLAPTSKTTDDQIVAIHMLVTEAFSAAASKRNEDVEARAMTMTIIKFFDIYETHGLKFFEEHLAYEIDRFLKHGMRPDMKMSLD